MALAAKWFKMNGKVHVAEILVNTGYSPPIIRTQVWEDGHSWPPLYMKDTSIPRTGSYVSLAMVFDPDTMRVEYWADSTQIDTYTASGGVSLGPSDYFGKFWITSGTGPSGWATYYVDNVETYLPDLSPGDASVWVGDWNLRGFDVEADQNWGNGYIQLGPVSTDTAHMSLVDSGRYYGYTDGSGASGGSYFWEYADSLRSHESGRDDDDDYYQAYHNLIPVDSNCVLSCYAEAGWNGESRSDLWWGDGSVSLLHKVPPSGIPRPWAGTYGVRSASFTADTSDDLLFEGTNSFTMRIAAGPSNTFTVYNVEADDSFDTELVGDCLEGTRSGIDGDGDYFEDVLRVARTEDGRMYFLFAEAGFDSPSKNDFWWFDMTAGVGEFLPPPIVTVSGISLNAGTNPVLAWDCSDTGELFVVQTCTSLITDIWRDVPPTNQWPIHSGVWTNTAPESRSRFYRIVVWSED